MNFQILVPIALLSLYIQETYQYEYEKSDIAKCLNHTSGLSSCRYVLQWALYKDLKIQNVKVCLNFWSSVSRILEDLWPRKAPSSISRFRLYGEECDPVKENEFFYQMLLITQITGKDAAPNVTVEEGIDPSYEFYMRRFGNQFETTLNDHRLQTEICDPRWLLHCDEKSKNCECIHPQLLQHSPNVKSIVGDIGRLEVGQDNEKKYQGNKTLPVETYRCFPTHGSPCGVNLLFAGMCSTDCQYGQECFEGKADDGRKYRRCCSKGSKPDSVRNCSGKAVVQSSGNTLEASTNALLLFLLSMLITLGLFCSTQLTSNN